MFQTRTENTFSFLVTQQRLPADKHTPVIVYMCHAVLSRRFNGLMDVIWLHGGAAVSVVTSQRSNTDRPFLCGVCMFFCVCVGLACDGLVTCPGCILPSPIVNSDWLQRPVTLHGLSSTEGGRMDVISEPNCTEIVKEASKRRWSLSVSQFLNAV